MTDLDNIVKSCPFVFYNVNVNAYVYSLISPSVLQTYTPGIGTLSYTASSPLGGIQLIFCSECHSQITILQFSFQQVPITSGWAEAAWSEKFARHIYTWPAVGIEPQTFWSWVQNPIHLATCSHNYYSVTSGAKQLELQLLYYFLLHCWSFKMATLSLTDET